MKEYSELISLNAHCLSCVEDIINYFSQLKQAIKLSIENSGQGIKSEFHHLMDIINSREKQWMEIYMESTSMKGQAEEALPKWPLMVMLFGAICCLSCSAIFHLFYVHSERINYLLNRVDYAGISILIMGSCYPPNYYLFNCEMCNNLSILIIYK